MSTEQDPARTLFERAIWPVAIPLAALVVIEIVAVALSRVLLAAGKTPAVVIALAAAVAILVGGALVAAAPRLKSSTLIGLLVLTGVVVVAAGAWGISAGYAPIEGHGEEGGHAAATVEIVADNIAFDVNEFTLPAGEEAEIVFDNQDAGIPHNVAIYETEAADADLFVGEIFNGPEEMTYTVGPYDAGTYYFQCDVHPNMNGTVTVE